MMMHTLVVLESGDVDKFCKYWNKVCGELGISGKPLIETVGRAEIDEKVVIDLTKFSDSKLFDIWDYINEKRKYSKFADMIAYSVWYFSKAEAKEYLESDLSNVNDTGSIQAAKYVLKYA